MTARYSSALEEIRSLLASRSQADPVLEARDVWEELTCYPVPSLRTVRRLMEQIRNDQEFGRRGQSKRGGQRGQTKGSYTRSTYRMTNAEIAAKIAELDRRAEAHEHSSVDVGTEIAALLDAVARKENSTRHRIGAYALLKYVQTQYPDMCPSTLQQTGFRH